MMNLESRPLRLLPAIILFAVAGIMLMNYVTDDTYIHMCYARNLVEHGEISFNVGDPTYGATSPLWIFLIAGLMKLGIAPLLATKILGVSAGLLTLLIFDKILAAFSVPASWRWWGLLLVASDAWFLRWSFSGMETPLAGVFLLLLLMPAIVPSVSWLAWGVVAGLATLARPEFMLLWPVALYWHLWACYEKDFRTRPLFKSIIGFLLIYGPWLAYASSTFGRMTPETAAAKSYGLDFNLFSIAESIVRSIEELGAIQGILWLAIIPLLVIVARSGERISGTPTHKNRVVVALIALSWIGVLVGGYALKKVWIISRYLSPLLPIILLTALGLIAFLRQRLSDKGAQTFNIVLGVAVVLTICWNGFVTVGMIKPHADKFSTGVEECFIGTGQWISENTPEGSLIAAHDIGALGWVSNRKIIDLAGLVSPEILELGRNVGFETMVASGAWLGATKPDYVYDRTVGPPRWDGVTLHGITFELIRQCTIQGVGLKESKPMNYALYKLEREQVTDEQQSPVPVSE
ncbi:MAG: hypothetical protein GY752_01410 [bacterium]|nr:hypothetical protein [bacterium]